MCDQFYESRLEEKIERLEKENELLRGKLKESNEAAKAFLRELMNVREAAMDAVSTGLDEYRRLDARLSEES